MSRPRKSPLKRALETDSKYISDQEEENWDAEDSPPAKKSTATGPWFCPGTGELLPRDHPVVTSLLGSFEKFGLAVFRICSTVPEGRDRLLWTAPWSPSDGVKYQYREHRLEVGSRNRMLAFRPHQIIAVSESLARYVGWTPGEFRCGTVFQLPTLCEGAGLVPIEWKRMCVFSDSSELPGWTRSDVKDALSAAAKDIPTIVITSIIMEYCVWLSDVEATTIPRGWPVFYHPRKNPASRTDADVFRPFSSGLAAGATTDSSAEKTDVDMSAAASDN